MSYNVPWYDQFWLQEPRPPYQLQDDPYICDLKAVAPCYGFSGDEIDMLLAEGFSPDEIEEYIYCG